MINLLTELLKLKKKVKKLETDSGSGGSGASYLVYTALLSQSGTDAPVATVLENTLGSVSYDGSPQYLQIRTDIDYQPSKAYISGFSNDGKILIPIYNGLAVIGYYSIYPFNRLDKLCFEIDFLDTSCSQVDWPLGGGELSLPEIRVYP